MKRERFTEEQIIGILKQAETGTPIKDLIRTHGIAEGTYYRWKAKYGGLEVARPNGSSSLKKKTGG